MRRLPKLWVPPALWRAWLGIEPPPPADPVPPKVAVRRVLWA